MELYDAIGNVIKEGDLIVMPVTPGTIICSCEKIIYPSMLTVAPGKSGVEQLGQAILVSIHRIPFSVTRPNIAGTVARKPPDIAKLTQA